MITLTPTDYLILVVTLAVVIVRILSDIREIISARAVKGAMRAVVKKSFSPKLTVIIPLQSLEDTKQTLQHLQGLPFSVFIVAMVDSKKFSHEAGALRYFVSKNSLSRVKVVTRKNPNTREVAGMYAKSGLVVVLPDTARLSDTFYWDTVLPFGDLKVDALTLASNVRPDKTLTSGVEVLITAWRRYLNLGGAHDAKRANTDALAEGVIMRAKYSRRPPKKELHFVTTRKSAYSIAAQKNLVQSWSKLRKSASFADFITVLLATVVTVLLLQGSSSLPFAAGVLTLLYGVTVWWSLGIARLSLLDRISVLLLSPIFFAAVWSLVIGRMAQSARSR